MKNFKLFLENDSSAMISNLLDNHYNQHSLLVIADWIEDRGFEKVGYLVRAAVHIMNQDDDMVSSKINEILKEAVTELLYHKVKVLNGGNHFIYGESSYRVINGRIEIDNGSQLKSTRDIDDNSIAAGVIYLFIWRLINRSKSNGEYRLTNYIQNDIIHDIQRIVFLIDKYNVYNEPDSIGNPRLEDEEIVEHLKDIDRNILKGATNDVRNRWSGLLELLRNFIDIDDDIRRLIVSINKKLNNN